MDCEAQLARKWLFTPGGRFWPVK